VINLFTRVGLIAAIVSIAASIVLPQADASIRKKFKSKNYTVTWGAVLGFPRSSQLEVGYGNGHGGTLRWLRFQPSDIAVEVLSIEFDEGWHPYDSKWQPDLAPLTVKKGVMPRDAYTLLLRQLAIVNSARLRPIQRLSVEGSSNDFWVSARVAGRNHALLDLDWAGYWDSLGEINFAKPSISVDLAREAVSKKALAEHNLTSDERRWVIAKFIKDWQRIKDRDFYWWVAERLIIMIGPLGDNSVIPTLLEILDKPPVGGPSDRRIYNAINAITRISGKDVRPKPIEEMDLDTTRLKVLAIFKDVK
jgi:hypothetical protein